MYLTEKTPTNVVSEIINCYIIFIVVQSLSHVWLCDPMDCSTSGFPVLHHLLEFIQSHIQWVRDATQPSHPVFPFSSFPQSFPASESFPMSWFFASGGQSIGASASASVFPINIQNWFPLGLTALKISLHSKGISRGFSNTTIWKHQFFSAQPCLWSSSHMTVGKTIA